MFLFVYFEFRTSHPKKQPQQYQKCHFILNKNMNVKKCNYFFMF